MKLNKKKITVLSSIIVAVILLISCLAYAAVSSATNAIGINWECSPMDESCYTRYSDTGANQFSLKITGYDAERGVSLDDVAITNCIDHGLCEPGYCVIQGKTPKAGWIEDVRGTGEANYDGYWIEGDGYGYYHYNLLTYPVRWDYQRSVSDTDLKAPAYGGISMQKTSTVDWSLTNPHYSFEGCKYYVFNNDADADNFRNPVATITLNKDGYGETDSKAFRAGPTYVIRESIYENEHGTNYLGNNKDRGRVQIQPGTCTKVTWDDGSHITKDRPIGDPETVTLKKSDEQVKKAGIPEGDAKLKDAYYEYSYYTDYFSKKTEIPEHSSSYQKHWIMATNENGETGVKDFFKNNKVGGDDFYFTDVGTVTCPLGTYVIHETKAPEGYLISEKTYIVNVNRAATGEYASNIVYDGDTGDIIPFIEEENYFLGNEQVKKGDLEFHKTNTDGVILPGVPFKITSTSTGEWHVMVTDENADVNTTNEWAAHTNNTNYFDQLLNSDGSIPAGGIDETIIQDALAKHLHTGTWFCWDKDANKFVAPDSSSNKLGALPYDTYIIEELPVTINKPYQLVKKQFVISDENKLVNLGTIEDSPVTNVTLQTNALSIDSTKTLDVDTNITVNDTIEWHNLGLHEEYKIKSWLVDQESQRIVSDTFESSLYTEDTHGSTTVPLKVNTTNLVGKTLTVFEELYKGDVMVASHVDPGDPAQQVTVKRPTVTTYLVESSTAGKTVNRVENCTLTDYISYTNLDKGKRYKIDTKLVNKSNNTIVADVTNYFVPEANEGATTVNFSVDTRNFNNADKLVCQEYIYLMNGDDASLVVKHDDLSDVDQTVQVVIPTITMSTYATKGGTYSKELDVKTDEKVSDKIHYKNVEPNFKYTIFGILYDNETGQPLLANGNEVSVNESFIPDSSEGDIYVEFNLDTTGLKGKTITCYEYLYLNGTLVASHLELADYDQQVKVVAPSASTVLETDNGAKTVMRAKDTKLVDHVTYQKLIPNKTYHVNSKLLSNDGKWLYAEQSSDVLIPTENGTFDTTFTIDTSSAPNGAKIVCTQEIIIDGKVIVLHDNLDDSNETVTVIGGNCATYLHEGESYAQVIKRDTNVHLVDTVHYEKLSKGNTYTITGTLKDTAGNDFVDSAGRTHTVTNTFIPEDTDGITSVEFNIDTSTLPDNTKIVAFEVIKLGDSVVASHEDLTDPNQTVEVLISDMHVITEALSTTTSQHQTYALESEQIVDKVIYTGVEVGFNYKLKGELHDKQTGEIIIDKYGKQAITELEFVTEYTYGEQSLPFDIDTRALQGHDLVCFEYLYDHTGKLRATHCDLNDTDQTVHVNNAYFSSDMTQVGKEVDDHTISRYENCQVVDRLYYNNLYPGKRYVAKGVLMNKKTGQVYINEVTKQPVEAVTNFTPLDYYGFTSITYNFDSTLLKADVELVSFVDISLEGKIIAEGKNIDDGRETVIIKTPKISTNIWFGDKLTKSFVARNKAELTDDLTWSDLPENKTMKVYSWLVNTETGLPVTDGTITPEEAKAAVDDLVFALGGHPAQANDKDHPERWEVIFKDPACKVKVDDLSKYDWTRLAHVVYAENTITNDSSVSGETPLKIMGNFGKTPAQNMLAITVVQSENTIVAHATDVNDSKEKIELRRSKIHTTLTDTAHKKEVTAGNKAILIDTVEYNDVIVGSKYIMEGKLINKSNGNVIATKKQSFTPEQANGTLEMPFEISTQGLSNTYIVAYEYLYLDNDIAAQHEDVNDANQTIFFKLTLPARVQTGDPVVWGFIAFLVACGLTAGIVAFRNRKNRS